MNILAAPPDFTLPAPVARRLGSRIDLAKSSSSSTSERSQQLGYPSPPMSDSPSPTRRLEQHAGASQSDRRSLLALNGLPPPPSGPIGTDPGADPRRPLLPQYTGDQQQYPPQLPHPQHPYQAPQPPSGPFVYHQPPGAPMPAPAFYPGVPVAAPYHPGYPGELSTGPSYVGHQAPPSQGSPPNDHALKTAKAARRTKAHVASACVNCKKAHLSCDNKRPCTRCVASNKQDTCYDVPHKKRGRPRLREDRTTAAEEPVDVRGPMSGQSQPGPIAQPWQLPRHRRPHPIRVLRGKEEHPIEQFPNPLSAAQTIDPLLASRPQLPTSAETYRETRPVAFLNIDLVVIKSTPAFQELFGIHGDVRGRGLGDLMEPGQAEVLQRLRNDLRDERETREPAYMPPINPRGEQEALEAVSVHLVETLTQPYNNHHHTWNFRLRTGHIQPMRVNVRLAKATIFFVALIVQPYHLPVASPGSTPGLTPTNLIAPLRAGGTSPGVPPLQFREYPYYDPTKPSPTSTSGPPSPYNFQAGGNSLPQVIPHSNSYVTSPITTRGETSYLQPYPPPQPPVPSLSQSYTSSSSRPASATSEPSHHRTSERPQRPESLQLPPLRGQQIPPSLISPQFSDPGNMTRERVRRREVSSQQSEPTSDPAPDSAKRRRLNIHEVLD